MITVAIVNNSTALNDAEVCAVVPALQTQVTRDFCPAWGIDATLVFVGAGMRAPDGAWLLTILDDSDQADALGYHEFESAVPTGYVFTKSDLEAGSSWTNTASHELLEMLADPWIFSAVARPGDHHKDLLESLEVCDACEADQFGYRINGVLVSDFVYPAWFGGAPAGSGSGKKFDHCGHITAAWQLLEGGYISVEKCHLVGDWIDLEPDAAAAATKNPPGAAEPAEAVPATAGAEPAAVPAATDELKQAKRRGRHVLLHDGQHMPASRIARGSRKWRRLNR